MPSLLLHLHRWISSGVSYNPYKMIAYFATYRPVFHPTTTAESLSLCTGLDLSYSFCCAIQFTQYRNKSLSFQHYRFSKYLSIEQWIIERLVSLKFAYSSPPKARPPFLSFYCKVFKPWISWLTWRHYAVSRSLQNDIYKTQVYI